MTDGGVAGRGRREQVHCEVLSGKFSEPSVTWPCVVSIFIGVHRGEGPSSNIPHSVAALSNDDNMHDEGDDYDDEDEDEPSTARQARLPDGYHLLFTFWNSSG